LKKKTDFVRTPNTRARIEFRAVFGLLFEHQGPLVSQGGLRKEERSKQECSKKTFFFGVALVSSVPALGVRGFFPEENITFLKQQQKTSFLSKKRVFFCNEVFVFFFLHRL
jgi:hypothetical protein